MLRRRYPNAHLVIAPARVQGEGAARDIARALRQVTRIDGVDVVIAGRGGGSIEDLWAFNEEVVARAIAASPVPVISAVGHETDVTIADFVADLRAPTPSAAAELVVRRKDEFIGHIDALTRRVASALRAAPAAARRTLAPAAGATGVRRGPRPRGAPSSARRRIWRRSCAALAGLVAAERRRRVEALSRGLTAHHPQQRLMRGRSALTSHDRGLAAALARRRHAADTRLREAAAHLHALSPLAVLGRGYAMCWTDDRTTLVRDRGRGCARRPRARAAGERRARLRCA